MGYAPTDPSHSAPLHGSASAWVRQEMTTSTKKAVGVPLHVAGCPLPPTLSSPVLLPPMLPPCAACAPSSPPPPNAPASPPPPSPPFTAGLQDHVPHGRLCSAITVSAQAPDALPQTTQRAGELGGGVKEGRAGGGGGCTICNSVFSDSFCPLPMPMTPVLSSGTPQLRTSSHPGTGDKPLTQLVPARLQAVAHLRVCVWSVRRCAGGLGRSAGRRTDRQGSGYRANNGHGGRRGGEGAGYGAENRQW